MDDLSFLNYSRDGDVFYGQLPDPESYTHEFIDGAAWKAQLRLENMDVDDLENFFVSRFMTTLSVHHAGVEVWRGYIGYMRLVMRGIAYTKDEKKVVNRATCAYRSASDTTKDAYTDWYENDESLLRFGPFEKALNYGDEAKWHLGTDGWPVQYDGKQITEPDHWAITEVDHNAYPFMRSIAPSNEPDGLQVRAYGPAYFANKILIGRVENLTTTQLRTGGSDSAVVYGNEYPVGKEIKRIVEVVEYQSKLYSTAPLLYELEIAVDDGSSTQVLTIAGMDSPTGAWDRLRELSMLQDRNGNYYRLRVMMDGGVLYEPWDYTPVYYLFPPPRGLQNADGGKVTWQAKPEIIFLADQSKQLTQPGGWLANGDIYYPTRMTMRNGTEFPVMADDEYTESDYNAIMRQNAGRLERQKDDRSDNA